MITRNRVFFLYREVAETLADCVKTANSQQIAGHVLQTLTHVLSATCGDAHRAAAGALGAFNARISLPERIEFAASAAAVCVAGKYWQERYGENQASRGIGV